MVNRPGDGHTVQFRSLPHGWIRSTLKSDSTWRKHFQAMAERDDESCRYCSSPVDDVDYTHSICAKRVVASKLVTIVLQPTLPVASSGRTGMERNPYALLTGAGSGFAERTHWRGGRSRANE